MPNGLCGFSKPCAADHAFSSAGLLEARALEIGQLMKDQSIVKTHGNLQIPYLWLERPHGQGNAG